MSKTDRYPPDQGRVKLRFIEVELEGANPTLIEGIKSMAAAMSRGNGAVQILKSVQAANGSNAVAIQSAAEAESEEHVAEVTEHDVPAAPRKQSPPRKLPPLNLVQGIDWEKPSPSLQNFVAGLDLDSATRKYVAIAHWFKEYRGTPAITVHHIYSAYKALGWTDLPKYPVDTLQDVKNKRAYKWMDGGAKGEYVINAYGDQQVAKWRKGNA